MFDFIVWVIQNIALAVWNFGYAITHFNTWLDWSNKESLVRFIYYGGSVEFFFVVMVFLIVFTAVGLWQRQLLWGAVIGLEGFANLVGRIIAWAGLLMVLQQIIIVFSQRIFAASEIGLGIGSVVSFDISWWSEELKLYNAAIVALCCAYTFVQSGHVRVDLLYAPASFRTKRLIDMLGALFFMIPMATVIWMYAWYFMWRHLVTPKVSASDKLELMLRKASILRWNVETIGFSPNGFNAYFLFKVLLVAFAGMVFLQAIAVFYRALLERSEGEESENRYKDRDALDEGAVEGGH
ncbi:TRAP transporter small permease subunit [Palleronia caenipelagi]|uniref:C4-dicarboxylate ABC transporter permease n=1 Tax=Palleronia caenipelagi TaxID=2489174 RepID=A0A547PXM1_9RHOB|nr:C4-dicarboxylate ABC transporter permease [Palleronia caenipelagi]TRD18900.1 C4-dicarboxylate ABC transporter permease [Palleronia caenipelagi]